MVTPALKKLFDQEGVGLIALETGADYLVQELRSADPAVEVVALAAGTCLLLPPPLWGRVEVGGLSLRSHYPLPPPSPTRGEGAKRHPPRPSRHGL